MAPMNDVAKQLQPGEEVLFVARPSAIRLIPIVLLAIVLAAGGGWIWYSTREPAAIWVTAAVTILPLFVALEQWIVLRSFEYVLTNHRVIRQTGILSRSSVDSYLDKINNVEHRQTLWGRMLGYGDVEIDTASETGMTKFLNIRRPLEFKRAVVAAVEAYRSPGRAPAVSSADKIRQLKSLFDDGLISQEEYEAKRKKLLEEI
jgi:uncharacterized membrane protein YdbT with pleckstrin-like domain